MAQKTPNNRSLKDNITISINEFNKACKLLFESFSQQASMQPTGPQGTSSSNLSSPNLYGINANIQSPQQHSLQQHQQQQIQHMQPPQQLQILQRMSILIETDKLLQKTLKQLEQHQTFQKEIVSIQKEIEEKDKQIASLASSLKEVESLLESEILEITKSEDVKEREISPEDLISYAHKISGTTSAPYGYQTNVPLMPLYKPPAPQEDMMRASTLFARLPLHLLRFYGLAEKDLSVLPQTPTTATLKGVSPNGVDASESGGVLGSQDLTTSIDSMITDDQHIATTATNSNNEPKLLVPPPNIPISTPPFNKQGPILTSLDLDLNPDLEDDEDEDDDDDDDGGESGEESSSSENEVEWD